MTTKELEKHNFLTWCKQADAEELGNAKWKNHEVWERLYRSFFKNFNIVIMVS
jgi:hypothetical protein